MQARKSESIRRNSLTRSASIVAARVIQLAFFDHRVRTRVRRALRRAKCDESFRFADDSLGADIIRCRCRSTVDWYRVAVVNRDEVSGFGCSAIGNVAV